MTQNWLRFEVPPPEVPRVLVTVVAEDTHAALEFVRQHLEPRLIRRDPLALDFRNLRACTQSFLHALLHQAVRLAWALRVPMYVVGANPTVQAQIEFVEAYSLGG